MKSLLADYSLAQIKDLMVQRGQKPFRALQLYQGIMQGKQWEEMTNLPQSFKEEWSQEFDCQGGCVFWSGWKAATARASTFSLCVTTTWWRGW